MSSNYVTASIIAVGVVVAAFVLRDGAVREDARPAQREQEVASVVDVERPKNPISQFEVEYPGPSAASLKKQSDDFYWAEATVNDRSHIRFMVDTGASICVLTAADAEKLGIKWREAPKDVRITTAGGVIYGVRVTLDEIRVSQVVVKDVDAVVLEGDLEQSLLGMSFLQKLREWRSTPQAIIIYQ